MAVTDMHVMGGLGCPDNKEGVLVIRSVLERCPVSINRGQMGRQVGSQ